MIKVLGCAALAAMVAGCGSVKQSQDGPPDAQQAGMIDAAARPIDAPVIVAKRVFVTSATYAANFGSVSVADSICNSIGSAKFAGSTWKAWISLAAPADVTSRLSHATVPYVLLDGTTIAANWTALVSGTIQHAIDRDENNAVLTAATGCLDASCFATWTATDASGQYTPNFDCVGWTSTAGNPGLAGDTTATSTEWTRRNSISSLGCSQRARLYCFEQ